MPFFFVLFFTWEAPAEINIGFSGVSWERQGGKNSIYIRLMSKHLSHDIKHPKNIQKIHVQEQRRGLREQDTKEKQACC